MRLTPRDRGVPRRPQLGPVTLDRWSLAVVHQAPHAPAEDQQARSRAADGRGRGRSPSGRLREAHQGCTVVRRREARTRASEVCLPEALDRPPVRPAGRHRTPHTRTDDVDRHSVEIGDQTIGGEHIERRLDLSSPKPARPTLRRGDRSTMSVARRASAGSLRGTRSTRAARARGHRGVGLADDRHASERSTAPRPSPRRPLPS